MFRTLIRIILFILWVHIFTLNAAEDSTIEAKKALASLEAYKKWSIEQKKQLNPPIQKEKSEKIEKVQKRIDEALALLKNPKRKTGAIAKVASILLSLNPTDIANAQAQNTRIVEKIKWEEQNGETIVIKDIENKEKIVKEWDWNYYDLVDIIKDLPLEWMKEDKK